MKRVVSKIKGKQRPRKFDPLVPTVPSIIAKAIEFIHANGMPRDLVHCGAMHITTLPNPSALAHLHTTNNRLLFSSHTLLPLVGLM
jgi:hypothetical protein